MIIVLYTLIHNEHKLGVMTWINELTTVHVIPEGYKHFYYYNKSLGLCLKTTDQETCF